MVENNDNNNNPEQEGTRVPKISNDEDNLVDGRLNQIESDSDTLEPQEFGATSGRINVEDTNELAYWAGQFQISSEELHAAVVMAGNSVSEIKKYLSA